MEASSSGPCCRRIRSSVEPTAARGAHARTGMRSYQRWMCPDHEPQGCAPIRDGCAPITSHSS
eukprot:4145572-Prymnesium_polylepis.1